MGSLKLIGGLLVVVLVALGSVACSDDSSSDTGDPAPQTEPPAPTLRVWLQFDLTEATPSASVQSSNKIGPVAGRIDVTNFDYTDNNIDGLASVLDDGWAGEGVNILVQDYYADPISQRCRHMARLPWPQFNLWQETPTLFL